MHVETGFYFDPNSVQTFIISIIDGTANIRVPNTNITASVDLNTLPQSSSAYAMIIGARGTWEEPGKAIVPCVMALHHFAYRTGSLS